MLMTLSPSQTMNKLQKYLNKFSEYCKRWILNISYHKIEIVGFNSRNTRHCTFKKGEHTIQITNKYKYLEKIISKSGSFLNASKHLAEQGKNAMQLFLFFFFFVFFFLKSCFFFLFFFFLFFFFFFFFLFFFFFFVFFVFVFVFVFLFVCLFFFLKASNLDLLIDL